jgi:phosphoglycolate phosphatase
MSNKKYSLIIFDWDGTLMDSSAYITDCMQSAIGEFNAEPRSDTQVKEIIGLSLEEAIQALYPEADDFFINNIVRLFRIQFMSPHRKPSLLFEGAEGMLKILVQRGYDLAIATGKSRQGLNKVLNETGLEHYFPVTRCADESLSKPHPQMLQEVLIDHDLKVEHALMIGDTDYDIHMANNAKMDSLAVSFGAHDLSRLLRANPLGVVDTLTEIPSWLNNYE